MLRFLYLRHSVVRRAAKGKESLPRATELFLLLDRGQSLDTIVECFELFVELTIP